MSFNLDYLNPSSTVLQSLCEVGRVTCKHASIVDTYEIATDLLKADSSAI
jgi:hypothetical protein